MEKRSAMTIAAGLVLAVLVGIVGMRLGSGVTESGDLATPRVETVTVVRRVDAPGPPDATSTTTAIRADDFDEDDFEGDEDDFEGDDD
ncbi:MAG: hypothetical protein ACXWW5_08410 [Actinomycetota bacterium]